MSLFFFIIITIIVLIIAIRFYYCGCCCFDIRYDGCYSINDPIEGMVISSTINILFVSIIISYSIKSIFQLNKEHDLNTWVVFVDLVKAFDTIYHELMFKLIGKFGIPKYLIRVIKQLYHEFQIEIKVVKCKEKIDYQTGAKQDDTLAPILFIIVMKFIYELVE